MIYYLLPVIMAACIYIGYRLRGNPYKIDKAHNERIDAAIRAKERSPYLDAFIDHYSTPPKKV